MKGRRALLIYVAVALLMAAAAFIGGGGFDGESEAWELCGRLSDAFLLPGALFAGVGGLSWVSQEGLFDIFGYGVRTIVSHFDHKMERESYYDYKVRREEKRSGWLWQLLIVGLACIVLSALLVIGYYSL